MTELLDTNYQPQNKEVLVDQEFQRIVASIEEAAASLAALEQDTLVTTPVGKPAGYADQGYRHG